MDNEPEQILTPEVMMRWVSSHNASEIVHFHNDMKRLMKNEIIWLNDKLDNETDKEKLLDYKRQKSAYLGSFSDKLKINTFLMMYSHLEEWLTHLHHRNSPLFKSQKNSLKRFEPLIIKILGEKSIETNTWKFLLGCGDIRNCLLHANGRIDLLKSQGNRENLTRFCNEQSDISIQKNYVKIADPFLNKFQRSIDKQINALL